MRSGVAVAPAPTIPRIPIARRGPGLGTITIEAIAIARFLHELATGKRQVPDSNTLVIVDEAAMVGTRDMAAVFNACTVGATSPVDKQQEIRSAKILLCGDRRQLESVAGGSALKAISD
jgi:hypothetical protein